MIKKLTYLLIFLIIAEVIVGIYYLKREPKEQLTGGVPTQKVPGPKFFFSPNTGNFKVNQTVEVKVYLDTKGKTLTGADSVIKYNPEVLEIVSDPIPGKIFPVYPVLKVKEDKGKIDITGTMTDPNQSPFTGTGEFATIVIRPLKEGKTNLIFDYTPGETNDSNLAEKETGNDVLTEVVNAEFNITK